MIAILLLGCFDSPPTPESEPFRIAAVAEPGEVSTRVTVEVRTPGGDLAVHRAELRDAAARLDGTSTPIEQVVFAPGIHGCTVTFDVPGSGLPTLSGRLDLINVDGSRWASLELPKETSAAPQPGPHRVLLR